MNTASHYDSPFPLIIQVVDAILIAVAILFAARVLVPVVALFARRRVSVVIAIDKLTPEPVTKVIVVPTS